MALPLITTPLIPITVPYKNGELELLIRQFITGEYKVIMEAYNTNHTDVFLNTLSDVLNKCVKKPENFNINDYPSYVVDYIYYQIYAVSVSGALDIRLECRNEVEREVITYNENNEEIKSVEYVPCGTAFFLKIDSADVGVTERKDGVIQIADGVVIKMEYPVWSIWNDIAKKYKITLDKMKERDQLEKTKEEIEEERLQLADIIKHCIKEIWVNDEKYEEEKEPTTKEYADWLDTFPAEAYQKVINFIDDVPQLYYEQEISCPKCNHKSKLRMVGLDAFLK